MVHDDLTSILLYVNLGKFIHQDYRDIVHVFMLVGLLTLYLRNCHYCYNCLFRSYLNACLLGLMFDLIDCYELDD